MSTAWTADRVRQRAAELGPWFHNMQLAGVQTAPDHFLGDYPAVKWRHFADAIPADLTGKTVLDIGCNGGFYSMEMKRRGADRVVGIDFDDDYLAQARFAATVEGLDIEFRQMSVYDVAALGERFDVVFFIGVLYHLRHPLLALDLIHEHVTRDLLVFQSMQRGSPDMPEVAEDYPFLRDGAVRAAGLSEAALHRAELLARQHQLVDAQPCLRRRHAAQRRVQHRSHARGGSVHLPPCRRYRLRRCLSGARGGRAMIEAAMIWNEPNNKSHWDLEADPGWLIFAETCKAAGQAIRAEAPGLPRVLGGISPIDPDFIRVLANQGVLEELDAVAVHGFPLDWNNWLIDEWPDKIASIQAVTSLPVWVSEVGISTFGAQEVQEWGCAVLPSCCGAARRASTGIAYTTCQPPGPPPRGTGRPKAPPISGISTWACMTSTAGRSARPASSTSSRPSSACASGSTTRTTGWTTPLPACVTWA